MKPALLPAVGLSMLLAACSDDGTVGVLNDATDDTDDTAVPRDDTAVTGVDDIVTTAAGADGFSTLVAALEATGLDTVLADPDATFTVFAPTDEAFAKLGDETVAALLNDTETLSDILLYHVVPNAAVDAESAFALAGSTVTMANDDEVAISRDGERLFVNASEVIATDIGASNGIVHAIDTVLMPPPDAEEAPSLDIVETARAADGFDTLVAALEASGLDAVLSDPDGTFTVFAPTDDAFAALGEETIEALLADTDTLSDILLYHVIDGQAVDAMTATSLAGESVATANGASVSLSLRDGALFIDESRVVATDIAASNGIIHVIDAVLTPPAEPTDPVEPPPAETPTGTVFDIAREAGFDTLVAALEATGLDSPLAHPRDFYTVFAPTDEAFAALGGETVDALLADPDTLRDILLYHVLPGNVIPSSGLPDILGFDIQTGNGDFVRFDERDGSFFVNDSRIVTPDVQAVNGVVHVIDRVLLPPAN